MRITCDCDKTLAERGFQTVAVINVCTRPLIVPEYDVVFVALTSHVEKQDRHATGRMNSNQPASGQDTRSLLAL